MLERSLGWYDKVLPRARETAKMQGYRGARWPKMVGPDGRESPSGVGVFLIWQQPHPIYYAELVLPAKSYARNTRTSIAISFRHRRFHGVVCPLG